MGRKYSIRNPDGIYFLTFTVVKWIKLFSYDENCKHVIESLIYYQSKKGLDIYAYCIMPNHVHLIAGTQEGYNLSSGIRDLKRYTSIAIRKELERSKTGNFRSFFKVFNIAGETNSRNDNFQLWQQNNHPIELDNDFIFDQRLNYIHNNPVKDGFVDDPVDWKWSSAKSFEFGEDDLIELTHA